MSRIIRINNIITVRIMINRILRIHSALWIDDFLP